MSVESLRRFRACWRLMTSDRWGEMRETILIVSERILHWHIPELTANMFCFRGERRGFLRNLSSLIWPSRHADEKKEEAFVFPPAFSSHFRSMSQSHDKEDFHTISWFSWKKGIGKSEYSACHAQQNVGRYMVLGFHQWYGNAYWWGAQREAYSEPLTRIMTQSVTN